MVQILNHAHVSTVLNGHRFTGWANEDRPVEFPTGDDMVNFELGKDGGVYGDNVPMFGGKIIFRMAPTSPTAQWAVQQKENWKQAQINQTETTIYEGVYSDPIQGRSARLEGGFFVQCPDMIEPGQTFEIHVYFERITGNADGAKFRPPLASDAATRRVV